MMSDGANQNQRTLFVFDFDESLIDVDSCVHSTRLCPQLETEFQDLEARLQEFGGWTKLMDHCFGLVHQQGWSKHEILRHMKKVKLYCQALKAAGAVHQSDTADSIILSDSFTLLIEAILESSAATHLFSCVLTNPAWFDESEHLHVREYHTHRCTHCKATPNLCKGRALSEYRRQHQCYERVVYVGDGRNDLCPCLQLSEEDVVICREGYPLARLLRESPTSCAAQVHTLDFTSSLGDFISNLLQ